MDSTDATAADWVTAEIREIRRRMRDVPGLTLHRLLKRAGVSYSTFWRWEQFTLGKPGGTQPLMDRLARVKKALSAMEEEARAAAAENQQ